MIPARAWAATSASAPLSPWSFERRDVGANDVRIDIRYCGVCHSDLHFARSEWGEAPYPAVPGHEIVGHVAAVGSSVSDLKVGDVVGVGCLVDSCRTCPSCAADMENYCDNGNTGTYGGVEKETGRPTYGGYSNTIVVDRHFVLHIPQGADLAATAPLLCAGITTYSPLRHWNCAPGMRVGVVGLGGLGHMAVKLAKAMGAEVTLFTTSPGKTADAARLGASRSVISKDEAAMRAAANSLDLLIDTVAAPHNLDPYLNTLYRDGTLVTLGAPAEPHPQHQPFSLIFRRRAIAGSLIGGIAETQEMLDFCAAYKIGSDVEVVKMADIDTAWERMLRGDVKYRFVIDMSTI
ncbi:MAG: NAD(P)-dependent alcohol dehydrogenase [Gemmatimonadota bacterium]